MRVPLEWLKEYVAVRVSAEALAERLTMAGLEVTALEQVEGQAVFDIDVTPNRADCLSILGIAREVAAFTGQRVKLPQFGVWSSEFGVKLKHQKLRTPHSALRIRIEDRQGCERYIGRLIDDVRVAPSPQWMQRRLMACGARPINNIVDVTNYVLLEYGQPLHAFDFGRLEEGMIVVRRAQPNESLTTLDGVARTVSSDALVIADAKRPVAIAGVMGGMGSEVTRQTRTVLLESALFDPVMVRRTARKLGLVSESSYRFERGVDPMGVEVASERASALIQELGGGKAIAVSDAGTRSLKRTGIMIDSARASRWLGMPLSPTVIRTTLARLSCHVASSATSTTLHVGVPSFRRDLTQDVDLYEELARLIGYDRIPTSLPSIRLAAEPSRASDSYKRVQVLKQFCAGAGLTETINWSLISEGEIARLGYRSVDAARLANPLSQDHAYVRPTLLAGLLQTVRRNLAQGAASVCLFEVGRVIPPTERRERLHLGIALAGLWSRDWQRRVSCDFFQLKGLVEAVVLRLWGKAPQLVSAQHLWAEPHQGAALTVAGRPLGIAGQVSRALAHSLDIEQEIWCAEICLEPLLAATQPMAHASAPPLFPPVKRDLSLLVGVQTPFASLDKAIRDLGAPLASHVELIDRYVGKPVPAGKHSLTFSIEYRDPSKTLTATEVDARHERIRQMLVERFGAQLRS